MAFCSNCGTQMSDTASSCPNCGHPSGRGAAAVYGTRTEGLAITSLILGIAGFLVCPLVLHILAIVFGNQAKTKIRNDPTLQGDGMAQAGIVLGWIGIAFSVIVIIFVATHAMP